ncbi:MAG: type II secretion system protein [Cytophagaceae bacterium]|nr:MAG: type II secretion system protein [Cytophagaceae bacterium]
MPFLQHWRPLPLDRHLRLDNTMKRAFTLVEALILVAVIVVLAAFLLPVFSRHRYTYRKIFCQSNLKQIGLGFAQYVQDYDQKFPPARVTSVTGWTDALWPYIKVRQVLQCDKASNSATGTLTTDYFYNGCLSRLTLDKVKYPSDILLCGDGDDNAPPWNSWTQLPADAATNSGSPAQRHLNAAYYLYVDGHVKWIRPQDSSPQSKWDPQSS